MNQVLALLNGLSVTMEYVILAIKEYPFLLIGFIPIICKFIAKRSYYRF